MTDTVPEIRILILVTHWLACSVFLHNIIAANSRLYTSFEGLPRRG